MAESTTNPTQQTEKKPEQKSAPSSVDTFETVMKQLKDFLTNPLVVIMGIITTIFLVRRQQNNDLVTENTQLKERLRILELEVTEIKRKFKKLKAVQEESNSTDQTASQEFSIDYKSPYKLPIARRKRLFLGSD